MSNPPIHLHGVHTENSIYPFYLQILIVWNKWKLVTKWGP